MAIAISAQQRDALYDQILDHVGGIDDLRMAVARQDFANAERLARQFADELRLVNEDLGWGEGSGEPVELSCPPELLRRVFARLGETAEQLTAFDAEQEREVRELQRRNAIVAELCNKALAELEDEPR